MDHCRVGWGRMVRGRVPRHCPEWVSCRSKPTPSVAATSQSNGTGRRTRLPTMRPCGNAAPDRLVHRRGCCDMESGAPDHARRTATLFGPGDRHGADAAVGIPLGATPDRGAHRLHHRLAWSRSRGAGPHDTQPPSGDAGGVSSSVRGWSRAPSGGQHGTEALWLGRVVA